MQTVLGQVDGPSIDLVEHDCRYLFDDLNSKVGTFDHVDGGNEVVDDEVGTAAVVDADCVCFADESDGSVFAA